MLISKLLLKWADVTLSAFELVDLARAAVQDGVQQPMVDRMAGLQLGTRSHSTMMRLLLSSSLGNVFTHCPGEEATELILPSRWLNVLHAYPHEFRPLLGASRPTLRRFWRDFLAQPGNMLEFLQTARRLPAGHWKSLVVLFHFACTLTPRLSQKRKASQPSISISC